MGCLVTDLQWEWGQTSALLASTSSYELMPSLPCVGEAELFFSTCCLFTSSPFQEGVLTGNSGPRGEVTVLT